MANDTTQMTPVEIDTVLAENYNEQARTETNIMFTVKELENLERRLSIAVAEPYDLSTSRKVSALRELISTAREKLVALQEELRALGAAASPFQVEWYNRRWNRYFLVQNGNGHVHRGMNCHTCFATTTYSWLVNLADCDEDAMIEEWGERACTVCFPTAPANPNFNRPARIDREAQEARDAEKAAKAAAKAEKAITDVDGSPLRLDHGVIATKVAARNELSSQIQYAVFYGGHEAGIRKLVDALQAAGFDWMPVAQRAFKKAVKEAVVPADNPYRLTEQQIADTTAEITRNIEVTDALLTSLMSPGEE